MIFNFKWFISDIHWMSTDGKPNPKPNPIGFGAPNPKTVGKKSSQTRTRKIRNLWIFDPKPPRCHPYLWARRSAARSRARKQVSTFCTVFMHVLLIKPFVSGRLQSCWAENKILRKFIQINSVCFLTHDVLNYSNCDCNQSHCTGNLSFLLTVAPFAGLKLGWKHCFDFLFQ